MIEAIRSIADDNPADPLRDTLTKQWLKDHGFDLSQAISWWDEPAANCRHFRQEIRSGLGTR